MVLRRNPKSIPVLQEKVKSAQNNYDAVYRTYALCITRKGYTQRFASQLINEFKKSQERNLPTSSRQVQRFFKKNIPVLEQKCSISARIRWEAHTLWQSTDEIADKMHAVFNAKNALRTAKRRLEKQRKSPIIEEEWYDDSASSSS